MGKDPAGNDVPHFCLEFEAGDVEILVKVDDTIEPIIAFSQAMCFASPVWKRMLYQSFPSRSEGGAIEKVSAVNCLDFDQDDVYSLIILLNIAHLQFARVPSELPFERLLQVAVLAEKYDCVDIVRPWFSGWLQNEATESSEPGKKEWLFIAWAFGREQIFRNVVKRLVCDTQIDKDGDYNMGEAFYLENMRLPPGMFESVIQARFNTIDALLKIPYQYAKELEGNQAVCRFRDDLCDSLNYGSLLKSLRKNGLWPQKSPASVVESVWSLVAKLRALKTRVKSPSIRLPWHSKCLRFHMETTFGKAIHEQVNLIVQSHGMRARAGASDSIDSPGPTMETRGIRQIRQISQLSDSPPSDTTLAGFPTL